MGFDGIWSKHFFVARRLCDKGTTKNANKVKDILGPAYVCDADRCENMSRVGMQRNVNWYVISLKVH